MPRISAFQQHVEEYEAWFGEHLWVYQAELRAVKSLLPLQTRGLEIGLGSGRFAAPLDIRIGIEPSAQMGAIALERGVPVIQGIAEALPLKSGIFDFALMVTTICFVDNPQQSVREAYRVLRNGGHLVIGLVDRDSPIGQVYLEHKEESVFYREATFFNVREVLNMLKESGFGEFEFRQTIFGRLDEVKASEPVKLGYGDGSFVVVRGKAVK